MHLEKLCPGSLPSPPRFGNTCTLNQPGEFAELLGSLCPGSAICSGSDVHAHTCRMRQRVSLLSHENKMDFSWNGLGNATLHYDSGAGPEIGYTTAFRRICCLQWSGEMRKGK